MRFDSIGYDEVLARHLAVMDTTATSLAMDNSIPVIVFALAQPENIRRVLHGRGCGHHGKVKEVFWIYLQQEEGTCLTTANLKTR